MHSTSKKHLHKVKTAHRRHKITYTGRLIFTNRRQAINQSINQSIKNNLYSASYK